MIDAKYLTEVANEISADNLWQWHVRMAKFGGAENVEKDGMSRLALSEKELEAKSDLIAWAKVRGYRVFTDAMANLYVERKGRQDTAPVATGSHIDTQIAGGRFDGIFGVLAGLTCLDVFDRMDIETEKPIVVIAWTNEEGSRFTPGAMGSRYFSGQQTIADFADSQDTEGRKLSGVLSDNIEQLSEHTEILQSPPDLDCYIEAHIEQGPILEQSNISIGAVTGIQGTHWFEITITGESAHAGTTPLATRQDAVVAALEVMTSIRARIQDPTDTVRLTIGRIEVTPNSPNTVANQVFFTVDLRHPDRDMLEGFSREIEDACHTYEGACQVEVQKVMNQPPCVFPETMVEAITQSADALSISRTQLPSGAFHDALFVAHVCPSGMIFVPCHKGISHNPAEYSKPQDLADGTRVLAATLLKLAGIAQAD